MQKTYVGRPRKVGDEVKDEDGTWRVIAIEGSVVQWELVQPTLAPAVQRDIEFHIQPEFTAWRRQLIRNIPNVMQSSDKNYVHFFFKPLTAFIENHHLENANGQFMLDPFTDDLPRLRLLYRLYLLYKKQLRLFRTHGPREPVNHEQVFQTAQFTAGANKEQEELLTERIEALEEEVAKLKSQTLEQYTLFDSDSDDSE